MKLKLLAIATITAFTLASCDSSKEVVEAKSSATKEINLPDTTGNVYYREVELHGKKYLVSRTSDGYWIIGPEVK